MYLNKIIILCFLLSACSSIKMDCHDLSNKECRSVTVLQSDNYSVKFKIKRLNTLMLNYIWEF